MKLPFLSLLTVAALTLSGCMGASDTTQIKTATNKSKTAQAKADDAHDHAAHDHGKDAKPADPADDAVKAERDKLSAEDRKLVDAQEWCVISNGNRLGVMGAPIKVMVKDQPVFLCCAGCKDAALKDADKTLAKLEELKTKKKEAKPADGHDHGKDGHAHAGHHGEASEADIKAAREKLSAEDRALVEAQEWCAVNPNDRLGCMDTPIKIMVKGQPVFICCNGCKDDALKDEDKTLAKVEELKAKKKAAGGK
jgi:hypothetical protein